MRRYYQRQLLDIIKTIKEANIMIERFIKKQYYDEALSLLVDCHEGAVNIGNRIEELEGEGIITVTYLEAFCDMIYQAGVEISEGKESKRSLNLIHNQIIKIEESIINDINGDMLEIVFLPYKAAMWDSMESVWLAAKDDLQCNAFVVPIPYYDKLQGGGLGQMHYEGDQYPDYVPVVDYRTYNIEARHPDIIFIHNPYDDGNYVTTVHPNYYSQRLKNYTDLLAYIPYFVVTNDVLEHFCTCSGVLFADRVFLQSEKIRDTYVRVYNEFIRQHNYEDRFGKAESKFVAAGSPKFEKVIKSKPEDFTIPDSWRRLTKSIDVTQKKIVLYNTSIGAILEGNKQYINKLRNVLNIFRNRDDVLLWWRPHPLNEVTYRTMRPQLLKQYEQIVADYKREGWGIYDDTADLHRSLALSSMYFGDGSSLVALYQCTGKPILLQDTNFSQYDLETTGIVFDRIIDDDKYIWFVSATYNALFRMEKETWKLEYKGEFPEERFNVPQLYKGIVKCGEKLYFAPFAAKEGAIYNISTNRFDKISFKHIECRLKTTNSLLFNNAVSYKECIYFIPFSYPAIVKLNTLSGELEYYTDWADSVEKAINNQERGYFYSYYLNNNELILPCGNANAVIIFSMESGESEVYVLGESSNRYVCACYDGTNYWLCTIMGAVFRWDRINNVITEVISAVDDDQLKLNYIDMLYINGYIWLFPYKADRVIKINILDNSIENVDGFESELSRERSNAPLYNGNFIMASASGDIIYIHTGKSNHFIRYDTLNGKKREEAILPGNKILADLHARYYYSNSFGARTANDCNYGEIPNINFSINEFMDYNIASKSSGMGPSLKLGSKEIIDANTNAGQNIYQSCKITAVGEQSPN